MSVNRKKKIGIITYWESNDNYGQQLQCWALQHCLRERGYDAFLIRQYVWPNQHKINKRGIKRIKQGVKEAIACILYATNLAYKPFVYNRFAFCLDREACRRQFPCFRKKNLKMSRIYSTPEALVANPPKADVYITGSDQVWNYSMPDGSLQNFFLQFGDKKITRIAYAPSIGHHGFPDELKEKIKSYLKAFTAISVREDSAVSVINELGYDVTVVLDPTMLLRADDYLQLAKGERGEKCVFIYSMNYTTKDDIPFGEIKEFAKQRNLPIIVTPGSGYLPAKELFEGVEYRYATIPQWIQHIANAEVVVTASFHGVVMSLLMHRPVVYTPLKGKLASSNNRVLNLLYKLGLETLVYKGTFNPNANINWVYIDDIICKQRQYAQQFLYNSIEL